MSSHHNWILYDGECPFCSQYVRLVRLQNSVGEVKLINARNQPKPDELVLLEEKNLDINQGMALHLDGELYFGADCVNRIALLSSKSDFFNKINYFIMKNPTISRFLYPILRTGRNTVIFLLGKSPIK